MARPPLHYRIANWFSSIGGRIGDTWDRLISPVESFFQRLSEGVLTAFDSFEGLESVVVRVVRFVFWPVIFVAGLVGRHLPAGTGRGPFAGIARLFSRIGAACFGLAERLNLDGALIVVAKVLTPLWWPLAAVLSFVNAWLATRRPRELLLALPAVAFALPFAFVAVQGAMLGKRDIAERYKIAVRDAAEAGEYDKVNLYERKLAQLGVDTRRSDFRTAELLADDGDLSGAYERMKKLAPDSAPGYAPAHFWIVQQLLSGENNAEMGVADREAAIALAERHLDQLEELGIANAGVAQMRAYACAVTGRYQEAIKLLEPYSKDPGAAAAMRLRLLAQARDYEAARSQARVVLEMATDRQWLASATGDDYEVWALAAELRGDADQIEKALTGWRRAEPDDEKPRKLLATFRRAEAERLLATTTTAPAKTAEVLLEAINLGAPSNWTAPILERLATQRGESRYHRQVWDALMESSEAPEEMAMTMATAAAAQGEIVTARNSFRRLVSQNSSSPVVWNNYAWTLLQEPDPDPNAALEAVNKALESKPNDFRFRETRGQVLMALGRWDDAIADLEYALNGLPESTDVHRSLAAAYEATSQPQLAEIHRRQAGL